MSWDSVLSSVLLGGFGPEAVQGMIGRYLERIPVDKCADFVNSGETIFGTVTEQQWAKLRKAVRVTGIIVSYHEVINQLQKNRPDLLGTLMCTNGGIAWLQKQVEEAKKHLAS